MLYKKAILFLIFIHPLLAFAQQSTLASLQAVAFSNPLLQYQEKGKNKGPTIEILNAILKDTPFNINVTYMPWARAFSIAKNTPNTLILSMLRTPEREDSFHWLIKVSQAARVFISLKSKPENHVETKAQAKHKLIAVVLGSSAHKELIADGFSEQKNLYIVANGEQLIKLLINGRIDLIYSDPHNVERGLQAMNKGNIAIHFKKITPENQRMGYIALNKNSDEKIVKQLQQAANSFTKTAQYRYLLAK